MITLPDEIHLAAMRKSWKVSYVDSPGKLIFIEHPNRELAIYGKHYTKSAALHAITRWVKLKAEAHLSALMEQLSQKVNVRYRRLIVRRYEAEWGNYTPDKVIGLNYVLIFFPPALAKHIIYHELAHTFTMQHSDKFWNKLAEFDRNWKKHKQALEDAYDFIPEWVDM